jgi:hypothetical protein
MRLVLQRALASIARRIERERAMRVTLNKGTVHSVEVQGGFTGPFIDLQISAAVAYELLQALEAKREEIREMANQYYDCSECGQTHHTSVSVCPTIEKEET